MAWTDWINTVVCMDCLQGMKQMPDGCVDLGYGDPPFNTKGRIGWNNRSYGLGTNDNLTEKEYDEFCKAWFKEARRVSKKLLVTPGVGNIGRYPNAIWYIVIEKPSSPSFNRFGGYNCWEPLAVYDKPLKRIPRDVVRYDSQNFAKDGREKHPCPDNLDMVRWMLAIWTREGDLVADLFAGSGQMCLAAKGSDRRFIGFDVVQGYVNLCNQRLAQGVFDFNLTKSVET